MCAQRRLRSAWASAQSDQSSLCAQWLSQAPKASSCGQRRLIRLGGWSAQADQSSLCAPWLAKHPRLPHADSEDWSDWGDAQADLSLRWAHNHFVDFVMRRLNCSDSSPACSLPVHCYTFISYLSVFIRVGSVRKSVFRDVLHCKTRTSLLCYRS